MGKKSRSANLAEIQKIARFRWEFLRRNPEYKEDFREYAAKFRSWFDKHGWFYGVFTPQFGPPYYQETPAVWRYFKRWVGPHAVKLQKKWGVPCLYPPEWEFDDEARCKTQNVTLMLEFPPNPPMMLWQLSFISMDKLIEALSTWVERNCVTPEQQARTLVLCIDVVQPLDKNLSYIRNIVGGARRSYEKEHGRIKPPEKGRRRFDQYDQYLRVWDLKQEGKTFKQIAELLFPGALSARERAENYYYRAKRLILGGYLKLR